MMALCSGLVRAVVLMTELVLNIIYVNYYTYTSPIPLH